MGSTTYDWSPVTQALGGLAQQYQYKKMLGTMFGQGPQAGPAQAQQPQELDPEGNPMAPRQLPQPSPMAGGNMAAMLPMLQMLGPQAGAPLLLQMMMKQREHDQGIQDAQEVPMTPQEKQAAGFRPDAVIYKNAVTGQPVVKQVSDMLSQGAVDQKLGMAKQEGLIAADNPLTKNQTATNNRENASAAETARHNKQMEFSAQHPFGADIGGAGSDGVALTGDPFLANVAKTNPGLAAQIKAVGTYRQPAPLRGTKEGIAFQNLVNQYNPSWDQTQLPLKQKARNDFGTGVQGKSIVAINNAMAHLGLLGQLADALGNGDIQLVNRARQAYEQQTGQPAPTTFDAVRNIAAQEVVKSVVPGGGGVAEREAAAADFKRAASPQQIHGAINGVRGLFSGQLGNYKRQYDKLTGLPDFNDFLSPETTSLMSMPISQAVGVTAPGKNAPATTTGKVINGVTYHLVNGQWMQE